MKIIKILEKSMFSFKPRPRWPLDLEAHKTMPTMRLVGKKGIKA